MKHKLSILNSQLSVALLLTVFLLYCTQAEGQTSYGYDLSGNRISRVITLPSQTSSAVSSADPLTEPPADPVVEPVEEQSMEQSPEQQVYSEMLKDFSVLIYPNPTKGELTVKIQGLAEEQTAVLRIYSASGSLILQKTGVRDMEYLDISHQPAGIYLLKITSEDTSTEWKIIKQ